MALRILHLSDTHLYGDPAARHYGVVDTAAALERTLAHAAEIEGIDLIALTGDLSDDGTPASYERLRAFIEPWADRRGAAIAYARGNHDQGPGFEEVLGAADRSFDLRGHLVIVLDSSVDQAGYGVLDDAQIDWARRQLAGAGPLGAVAIFHHPPVDAWSPLLKRLQLRDPARIVDTLVAGDARLVLNGHYHHALVAQPSGLPVVVAPGIANTTDAVSPGGSERATTGSGYAVIDLADDGSPDVVFVRVPHAGDGRELFRLSPEQIARFDVD